MAANELGFFREHMNIIEQKIEMSDVDPSSAKHQDNSVSLVQYLYFIAFAKNQIKCKVKNMLNCFAELHGR